MNIIVKTLREYIAKYGDVETWSLALKFQMLFFILKEQAGKETLNNSRLEPIHTLLYRLGAIENSGVVKEKSELSDKNFSDTSTLVYVCGKYRITYTEHNDYDMRTGIDTDCWLNVHKTA